MNKLQAQKQGLSFTGSYSRSKEEQKIEAAKLRSEGYRAIVVDVPDSKYSRGTRGTGYSVFAESKYFEDKRLKELKRQLKAIPEERKSLIIKHLEELNELEAGEKALKDEIGSR